MNIGGEQIAGRRRQEQLCADAADGMCFLVIEQLPSTNKACGCDHNNGNPEKEEGEPVVTAKPPRPERRPHSTSAGCRPAAAHVWSVADVAVWPIGRVAPIRFLALCGLAACRGNAGGSQLTSADLADALSGC